MPLTPAQAEEVPFHPFDPAKAQIGQLLFYDPILSGNRNISCGTCHHHDRFSGDGLSLGIGEGGTGVGPNRTAGMGAGAIRKRVPRHAPALWNIGATEFTHFFHDGRVSVAPQYGNGFDTPAEEWLPDGLPHILAVQALFPLTAQFEMAGNPKENEVAGAIHDRVDNAWPILAKRVRTIPAYGDAFVAAFDDVATADQVDITHIAIALADFMGSEWRSLDAPYDAWRAGEGGLTAPQKRGHDLFFGRANCAGCHGGPLFTDHKFHALALPPFGPGRTRRFDPLPRDVGRMAETDDLADAYRFRTPSLRNVTLTAPYGHNGAYPTLGGIIRHHADPLAALDAWDP
ncbi:MAG: cytochrome c peroxidase, partial [Pseudomonadota bacterium]